MNELSHSTYLNENKDAIIEKGLFPVEIMSFYHSLFKFQEKYFTKYDSHGITTAFVKDQGVPLVDGGSFKFPPEAVPLAKDSLREIIDIIERHQTGVFLSSLSDELDNNRSSLEESAGLLLNQDFTALEQRAHNLKIGLDEYIFVLVNWLKPLMVYLQRKELNRIDTDQWLESRCPFCGSNPSISKIVESQDNRRILHCGFCEYEWPYKRVSCVICGNEDNDTLGYYTDETNEMYRFDYCDKCKGYIKNLRIPKQFEDSRFDLAVENIFTAYLDASAIDKGYSSF